MPSTQLEYLGFLINTQTMTIALPPAKISDLQKEASGLLKHSPVPTKSLERFIGKLVATKPAVYIAPLRYRALQSLKVAATLAQQEQAVLSQEACKDLRWWISQLPAHCSSPLLRLEASTVITSDASIQGWGAVCQGVRTGGRWTAEESQSHINMLELKAAFLAIQSFFEGTGSSECLSETGQPDSNCVSEQDGWFFSDSPLSSCYSGLGLVSSSPNCFTSRIPTRRREHNRRLGIKTPPGQQRLAVMPVSFRHPQPHAGPIFDRFICLQNKPPVTFILQLEARPRCMHNRCILSIMGRNDSISLPPILPGRQSSVDDTPGLGRICLPDSTGMASTTLVPTGTVNVDRLTNFASGGPRPITQYELPTQPSASGREVVPDRLAYLRQIYEAQGFSQRVAELVIESWRGNTNAAYNSAWRKWHSWCCRRSINPVSATVASIVEFLTDQFDLGLQYRTINTMRSSISTTHPGIEGTAVGSHPLVSRLMRGMFNCRPPMPRYDRSWNIGTMIDFFTNHYKSASLTVLQLAKKAATLLAITNADRCSNLAALDRDHLKQTPTGVEFTVVQLTKTRSRKSSTPRKVLYHYFLENTEVCPVTVLQLYLDRTAEQVFQ